MFAQARRATIFTLAAGAGIGLMGCAAIPGLPGGRIAAPPAVSSPTSQPTAPEATPSARPTPSTRSTPSAQTTPSSRSSYTPRPPATPDANDIENGYLRRTTVELEVARLVREKTGATTSVECPDNLTAKVGTTMTCTIKARPSTGQRDRPVVVRVTSVEGRKVHFSIEVD